jgi:hypothetical protein
MEVLDEVISKGPGYIPGKMFHSIHACALPDQVLLAPFYKVKKMRLIGA